MNFFKSFFGGSGGDDGSTSQGGNNTSSSSGGSSKSGVAQAKQPESPKFMDFEFSNDPLGRQLEDLWAKFDKADGELAEGLLSQFVTVFAEKYDNVAFTADGISPTPEYRQQLNSHGHPVAVVLGLKREFQSVCLKIDKLLLEAFERPGPGPLNKLTGCDVTRLLCFVSRFKSNRRQLEQTNFLQWVVKLSKILLTRYDSLNNSRSSPLTADAPGADTSSSSITSEFPSVVGGTEGGLGPTGSPTSTAHSSVVVPSTEWRESVQRYIESLFLNCLEICINFIDPFLAWRGRTSPPTIVVPFASPTAPPSLEQLGFVDFLAGLHHLLTNLSQHPPAPLSSSSTKPGSQQHIRGTSASAAVNTTSPQLSPSQRQVQKLVLCAIGAVSSGNGSVARAFLAAGTVQLLVDAIGWPKKFATATEGESEDVIYEQEFDHQIVCLQVLRELTWRQPPITDTVEKLGGFEHLMDFILWCSTVFVDEAQSSAPLPVPLPAQQSEPLASAAVASLSSTASVLRTGAPVHPPSSSSGPSTHSSSASSTSKAPGATAAPKPEPKSMSSDDHKDDDDHDPDPDHDHDHDHDDGHKEGSSSPVAIASSTNSLAFTSPIGGAPSHLVSDHIDRRFLAPASPIDESTIDLLDLTHDPLPCTDDAAIDVPLVIVRPAKQLQRLFDVLFSMCVLHDDSVAASPVPAVTKQASVSRQQSLETASAIGSGVGSGSLPPHMRIGRAAPAISGLGGSKGGVVSSIPLDRRIIHVILDLFDEGIGAGPSNRLARDYLRHHTGIPQLQQHTLQFLKCLIAAKPKILSICRDHRIYDMLFSDFFFFIDEEDHGDETGADEESGALQPSSLSAQGDPNLEPGSATPSAFSSFAPTSAPVPSSTIVPIPAAPSVPTATVAPVRNAREAIVRRLKDAVLEFVQFVATLDGVDNSEECRYLMAVLEFHTANGQAVIDVCKCLIVILRHRLFCTQRALLRVHVLPTICRLITMQQKMVTKPISPVAPAGPVTAADEETDTGDRPSSSHGRFHHDPVFWKSRNAVLKVLDYLLSTQDLQLVALREFYVVNTIFSLLAEPVDELRWYALRLITALMMVVDPRARSSSLRDALSDSDETKIADAANAAAMGASSLSSSPLSSSSTSSSSSGLPTGGVMGAAPGSVIAMRELGLSGNSSQLPIVSSDDPTGATWRATKVKLFEKYIETFPIAAKEGDYVLVQALLDGIRKVLLVNTEHNQTMFKDRNCFIQIVSVLNVEEEKWSTHSLSDLCINVLNTITALLAHNPRCKEFFRTNISYVQLQDLILRAERGAPSTRLFDALFDMLCDGVFDPVDNFIIQNPDVIGLMFRLLDHCPVSQQSEFFAKFTRMLARSTLNQSYGCKASLLDSVLDLFPRLQNPDLQQKGIGLMEILGTHSITVKQLKRFFSLMKPTIVSNNQTVPSVNDSTVTLRHAFVPVLLQALQNMTIKDRPSNFFYFDGINSGLALPPIQQWPQTRGYTFCTWLRVESYDHPRPGSVPKRHYQPRLFSFLTRDGCGVETFFHNKHLTIQVILSRGKMYVETINYVLKPRQRWFHLALTHNVKPTFGTSEVKVYVDGKLKFKKPMKYPAITKPLTQCFIGTDGAVPKPRALFAQMGTIYFFDDVLAHEQIEAIYWLKSNYMNTFQPTDLDPATNANINQQCAAILNGSLTSKIFLTYNSKASDVELFLDNTPETNKGAAGAAASASGSSSSSAGAGGAGGGRGMHATRLPGTHQCVTRDVKDILDCLGGIQVLFPLFAQLDQPKLKKEKAPFAAGAGENEKGGKGGKEEGKPDADETNTESEIAGPGRQPAAEAEVNESNGDDEDSKEVDVAPVTSSVDSAPTVTAKRPIPAATANSVSGATPSPVIIPAATTSPPSSIGIPATPATPAIVDIPATPATWNEPSTPVSTYSSPTPSLKSISGPVTSAVSNTTDLTPSPVSTSSQWRPAGHTASNSLSSVLSGTTMDTQPSGVAPGGGQSTDDDDDDDAEATFFDPRAAAYSSSSSSSSSTAMVDRDLRTSRRLTNSIVSGRSGSATTDASGAGGVAPTYLEDIVFDDRRVARAEERDQLELYQRMKAAEADARQKQENEEADALSKRAEADRALKAELDYTIDPTFLVKILGILCNMISDNPSNQNFILQSRGFGVISHLIEQVSPRHLTVEALDAFEKLVSCVSNDRAFFAEALLDLMFNFELWIFADFQVQLHWLKKLSEMVQSRLTFFRTDLGIQPLLDALRNVCWFEPSNDSLCTHQQILHPQTQQVVGSRPTDADMRVIRDKVLHIIAIMVGDSITHDETRCIVHCLADCNDPRHLIDVLRMLVGLMDQALVPVSSAVISTSVPREIFRHLVHLGGADIFLHLLTCRDETVRVLAIEAIGRLMRAIVDVAAQVDQLFATIYRLLLSYPFTEATYSALFRILIGAQDSIELYHIGPSGSSSTSSGSCRSSSLILDGSQHIKCPVVLSVIFKLLLGTSAELAQLVMQDMTFVLMSDENKMVFLKQFGWQTWLFDLIVQEKLKRNKKAAELSLGSSGSVGTPGGGGPGPYGGDVVVDMVLNVFNTLLFHQLNASQDGWIVFQDSIAFLTMFSRRGAIDVLPMMTGMLQDILLLIRRESDTSSEPQLRNLVDNMARVIHVTEDCLLARIREYSAADLDADRDPTRKKRGSRCATVKNLAKLASGGIAAGGGGSNPGSVSNKQLKQDKQGLLLYHEMSAVWPLVKLLLDINEWILVNATTQTSSEYCVSAMPIIVRFALCASPRTEVDLFASSNTDLLRALLQSSLNSDLSLSHLDKVKQADVQKYEVSESPFYHEAVQEPSAQLRHFRRRNKSAGTVEDMLMASGLMSGAAGVTGAEQQSVVALVCCLLKFLLEMLSRLEARRDHYNNYLNKPISETAAPDLAATEALATPTVSPITSGDGIAAAGIAGGDQTTSPPASAPTSAASSPTAGAAATASPSSKSDSTKHVTIVTPLPLRSVGSVSSLSSSSFSGSLPSGQYELQPHRSEVETREEMIDELEEMTEAIGFALIFFHNFVRRYYQSLTLVLRDAQDQPVLPADSPFLVEAPPITAKVGRDTSEVQVRVRNASKLARLEVDLAGYMLDDTLSGSNSSSAASGGAGASVSGAAGGSGEATSAAFGAWRDEWVKTLTDSPQWRFVVTNRLGPITMKVEPGHIKSCAELARAFEGGCESLQARAATFSQREATDFHDRQQAMTTTCSLHAQSEINRRAVAAMRRDKVRGVCAYTWRKISRALTNERASWYTNDGQRVYWKLDKTENSSRMRRKLKFNYDGSPHKEASQAAQAKLQTTPNREQRELNLVSIKTAGGPGPNSGDSTKLLPGIALANLRPSAGGQENAKAGPEDPEWSVINTKEADDKDGRGTGTVAQLTAEEKLVYSTECWSVAPMQVTTGTFEITTTHVYFYAGKNEFGGGGATAGNDEEKETTGSGDTHSTSSSSSSSSTGTKPGQRLPLGVKDRRWALSSIKQIHFRRHQLSRNSLEIFFTDQTNHFFNFFKEKKRDEVYTKIVRLKPPNLELAYFSRNPAAVLEKSGLTLEWQRRRISNFDYLMSLNTIAGRTYNDLTQYPVFPWVIQDYTSDVIDLDAGRTYRDLSRPIGALNPDRLEMFVERYNSFDDAEIPKFHYGTHYSSAGTVLFYLIRMEPFTTQALQLQDGKFDHADRLFDSVGQTWKGCYQNPADVKELIPEFFYITEFLHNHNGFDLGVKADSKRPVGDIVLPPWAKTSHDFIRINRAALESEYVSKNLHHWIDLIFGYQQQGPAAVEAHNVFFHLTYEGSVDIDSIDDPVIRDAYIAQIDNFGQTPSQLLFTPHPERYAADDVIPSLFQRLEDLKWYLTTQVTQISKQKHAILDNALLFIHHFPDRIVTVGLDRILAIHRWKQSTPEYIPPFLFEVEKAMTNPRRIGVHFAQVGMKVLPFCFAASKDGRYLLSCGHWDSSFKCSNMETGKVVQSVQQHKDIVTCVAVDKIAGNTLVTGSKDSTVMVWNLGEATNKNGLFVNEKPNHILYGHDDEVTCVAVNTDLDVVVSGSKDGTCIIHTVRGGRYVRTLTPPKAGRIHWVAISSQGDILTYSLVDQMLHLWSLNGPLLCSVDTNERLYALLFSEDGKFLVTGGDRKMVVVRRVQDLAVLRRFKEAQHTIRSLAVTPEEQHLLVGLQTGQILIYALDAKFLRERTLQKLANLGF